MADLNSLEHLRNVLITEYHQLVSKHKAIELSNQDFETGSYLITQPGVYKLTENIDFNPNSLEYTQKNYDSNATSWDSSDPRSDQFVSNGGIYDDKAFGIGFFAAIVVYSHDVVIDLNNFNLQQSKEHALQQRFYSNIELADQPFISSQGPHDFGPNVVSADGVYIVNGQIGRSSHHGIHGNSPSRVLVHNVTLKDYEVCGIALNGAKNSVITDSFLDGTRADIPVLGIFSAARFLRPYLNHMETNNYSGTLKIQNQTQNIQTIKSKLKQSLNNVFQDLITDGQNNIDSTTHSSEYSLFSNPSQLIDGNTYGILLNQRGVAVLGFPENPIKLTENCLIKNVVIRNQKADIKEVPALPGGAGISSNHSYGGGTIQNDPIGAVFQTLNKDPNQNYITINPDPTTNSDELNLETATYLGNVVANAQALLSQAIDDNFDFNGLSTSRNSINYLTRDWIQGKTTMAKILSVNDENPDLANEFFCNGDSMFHVNKGVIGMKLDASNNVAVTQCQIMDVINQGQLGFDQCDSQYKNKVGKSHPDATYDGFGGTQTRGVSVASSYQITFDTLHLNNIESHYGPTYGMDIHLNTRQITLTNIELGNLSSGTKSSADLDEYNNNPSYLPVTFGIHVAKKVEELKTTDPLPRVTGELSSPLEKTPFQINMNTFAHI